MEQPAVQAKPSAKGPTADELAAWTRGLDGDTYTLREQASRKLAGAGAAAIDSLATAASGSSREASSRALTILKSFVQSDEGELRAKATAALEKLAKSSDSALARRAEQILRPPVNEPPAPQLPALRPMRIGGIQVVPGRNIQFGAIQIGGPGVRMIRMQNFNGRKVIDADEGDRKVHIEDDPQKGIEMSISEKVDGKQRIELYAARDAAELKKSHPEADKTYQKYAGQIGGGVQIQIQAQGIPQGAIPIVPQPGR